MPVAWVEQMNEALDYIEDHLCADMDLKKAAQIACCSVSGFQRVFSIVADVSLSEYIRRRKMTLAAFELQNSAIKVIDLALKYGYESPEAFSRAFHHIHGTSPTLARDRGVILTAYPRISLLLTIRGVVPMNYRIESKEAFVVYGIEGRMSTENEEHLKAIPQFWLDALNDGGIERLAASTNLSAASGLRPVHALCDYPVAEDDQRFGYMLFAHKTDSSVTEGYTEVTVPAATWAVFRTENHTMAGTSQAIQNLAKRIYTEWLPTAEYEKVDGYELELYDRQDNAFWSDVLIRVKPRN